MWQAKSKYITSLVITILSSLFIPAFAQQGNKPGIADILWELAQKEGAKAAIDKYHELKENHPREYNFDEAQLNILGYRLLGSGKVDEAMEVFLLNVQVFPESYNPWDSLAEAYLVKGDHNQARKYYLKALELNPDYVNSQVKLNQIYVIENYSKREHKVPMRDGVKLYTQVYTPKDASKQYPFMLLRTPYRVSPLGEDRMSYREVLGPSIPFAEEGYIFVYQDVRGTYMSEGEFLQMRPLEPASGDGPAIDESTDTYDTIEWLLKEYPGNNGRVGMWGISYPGVYAAMALVNAHPALAAVSPQAPPADWFMGDDWHHNGALFWFQATNWMRGAGVYRPEPISEFMPRLFTYPTPHLYDFFLGVGPVSNVNALYFKDRVPFWNQMMEHGTYDDFWKDHCTLPHYKNIKSAVMVVGGWFDAENLYGALKTYAAIEHQNPANHNTLVMGPWYHGGWAGGNSELLGDIDVRNRTAGEYYREKLELPFFNHYLKGEGEFSVPEALVFETGSNEWRSYDQWPPASAEQRNLYLRASQRLSFDPPEGDDKATYEEYLSDPAKPVPHSPRVVSRWSYDFMHDDQRFASRRPDVLVFKTEPLTEDLTIAGPIAVELFVSTTGTDADWVVKLIDVYPDDAPPNATDTWMGGYQMLVRGDVMRGRFRNSFENPEPFVPGEVTRVPFELQDINHTFRKGHRIMVQVQSSWFPLVDRNPQTYVDIYKAGAEDFRKAYHRVYFSKDYPSHLRIGVLKK